MRFVFAAIFLLASVLHSPALHAQAPAPSGDQLATLSQPKYDGVSSAVMTPQPQPSTGISPFSRFALAGALSPLGIDFQAAINVDRFMNVRGVGNVFNYSLNNVSASGFNLNGKVNLASAGLSLDVYPWPNRGFRVSPGALFYNRNGADLTVLAPGGTAFTLNSYSYYSSPSNPVTGAGGINMHARNPAPTITVGWGNLISRRGGHWSVPFELGAAMIGNPVPSIAFTGGQVCANPQGTVNCQNVVGNSILNGNLQAQLAKYQNALQPLRFYPIVSVGVGYSFPIRRSEVPAAF